MKLPDLKPLLKPLSALQQLMIACGCPWMVIGGVAASLLGKPRFTGDVDIVILINDEKKNLAYILKMALRFGFHPRIKDAAGFARNNKVLLLAHTKSAINVDISLGLLPFEQAAIKRRRIRKAGNVILYLPVPEDLIIFKAVAHRPQDMLDIREIISIHPKIDKKYVRKTVKEFARVLETPEILTDLETLFVQEKKK